MERALGIISRNTFHMQGPEMETEMCSLLPNHCPCRCGTQRQHDKYMPLVWIWKGTKSTRHLCSPGASVLGRPSIEKAGRWDVWVHWVGEMLEDNRRFGKGPRVSGSGGRYRSLEDLPAEWHLGGEDGALQRCGGGAEWTAAGRPWGHRGKAGKRVERGQGPREGRAHVDCGKWAQGWGQPRVCTWTWFYHWKLGAVSIDRGEMWVQDWVLRHSHLWRAAQESRKG